MDDRRDLPRGWRQPPETTAEPVPLRRPYLGRFLPHPDQVPQASPQFSPRPQPTRQERVQVPRRIPASQAPPDGNGRQSEAPARAAGRHHPAHAADRGGARRNPAPTAPQARKLLSAMRRWRPMRGIIGDETRKSVLWCEFGSCIERFAAHDALGERDLRARALGAGWRYDVRGRLACPGCARRHPGFQVGPPPGRGRLP